MGRKILKAPFLQIEMWLEQVDAMLEQGRNVDGNNDISKYGTVLDDNNGKGCRIQQKKYSVGHTIKKMQLVALVTLGIRFEESIGSSFKKNRYAYEHRYLVRTVFPTIEKIQPSIITDTYIIVHESS